MSQAGAVRKCEKTALVTNAKREHKNEQSLQHDTYSSSQGLATSARAVMVPLQN